jgi:uncharacterized RDD family membrane protein YckC
MQPEMNAIAQHSAVPVAGPKLDNRRVLAALIDLLVVAAGGAAILAAAGVLGADSGEVSAPLAGVLVAWALYYYFACESGAGQTLGKRLLKLRVVRTDGRPAGIREIAIRTVLRVVDMQFAYLVGLVVMLATGERRGRLGDLAAGTMIVSTDGTAAPDAPAQPLPEEEAAPVEEVVHPAEEDAEVEEVVLPVEEIQVPAREAAVPARPVDDDESEVTVRSVETVSAIDLVMGADEPGAGPPAASESPRDAGPE